MNKSHPPISMSMAIVVLSTICLLASGSGSAAAQDECIDGQPLLSPTDLTVFYEEAPVAGNRLSWLAQPRDSTSCYAVIGTDALTEYDVQVQGSYLLDVDRDIRFEVLGRGVVGDKTVQRLEVNWSSRNEVEGFVSGVFNLSNSGGIYSLDLENGIADQSNSGIPSYLSRTNVRALAVWKDGTGNSKVYAVIPGLPVVASSDGGRTWRQTLDSREDPLLTRLANANTARANLAVSPLDSNLVFVGTSDGIFRSRDGGASFERVGAAITPGVQDVVMIKYELVTGRLFVCVNGLGLLESSDDGETWNEITTLRVPKASADSPDSTQNTRPVVNDIVASPVDEQYMLVGLRSWGVYGTQDGGLSWQRRDGGMTLGPSERYPRGRKVEIQSVVFDSSDPNRVLAASSSTTPAAGMATSPVLFISEDLGVSWADSVTTVPNGPEGRTLPMRKLLQNAGDPQEWFCSTPASGLLHSADGGFVWTRWYLEAVQPPLTEDVGDIAWHPTNPGEILMTTEGGGVYEPGDLLRLSDTIDPNATDDGLETLHFGLEVSFTVAATADSNGLMRPGDGFRVRSQTFQGYAVWRAQDLDPQTGEPLWDLLGLYDLSNPEFCYTTACEDPNPLPIQGCFADKRANCFDFEAPDGRIHFFDRDIYDGFTYRYAVSTFDYGFTGNTAPTAIARDMEFSPRSEMESSDQAQNHIRPGNYNETPFTVSGKAAADLSNIWVVPNPLRRDAGWDTGGASSVHFVNVSSGSKAEIYTMAGDLVVELTNYEEGGSDRGVIVWDTRNGQGELVTSDVYIWRVTNQAGEERLGRLTIIR